jgi:hypothetical protein
MKKILFIVIIVFLMIGCSVPSEVSQEKSIVASTPSITSAESEPELTGIYLYMKCFNEGKFDVYKLKLGDPLQNAVDEFGPGEKKYYGLGGDCYDFGDIVVSFAEGTKSYEDKVINFDIVGKNITVYGLTTGLSTVDDVKMIFGEPEAEWMTGHYSYEAKKTQEDTSDEGEKYFFIKYYNNKEFFCAIDFFFEDGILRVISLGKVGAFNPN